MIRRHPIYRSLFRLLSWGRNVRSVEQAAGEVARECGHTLRQRIYPRVAEMTVAQIRGYVRAQATALVESEVDHVLCRHHLSPALCGEIREAALGQLVGTTIHDVLSGELPATMRTMAA